MCEDADEDGQQDDPNCTPVEAVEGVEAADAVKGIES